MKAQVLGGLPFLRISVDRDRILRYGINAAEVLDVGVGPRRQDRRPGRRGPATVRGSRSASRPSRAATWTRSANSASPTRQGRMIPMEDLADIAHGGQRGTRSGARTASAARRCRPTSADATSPRFVAEAQRKVAGESPCTAVTLYRWGGTFENLQSATKRLTIVVPIALAMIFLLLYRHVRTRRSSARPDLPLRAPRARSGESSPCGSAA